MTASVVPAYALLLEVGGDVGHIVGDGQDAGDVGGGGGGAVHPGEEDVVVAFAGLQVAGRGFGAYGQSVVEEVAAGRGAGLGEDLAA